MGLPNFLIIGAHKSGTTALYEYLDQHPEIFFSSLKEPGYFFHETGFTHDFDEAAIRNRKDYEALFAESQNAIAIGEASTGYLFVPGVPQKIVNTVPDVKLIAILRNPIERAYSHYLMNVRDGLDSFNSNFSEVLAQDRVNVDSQNSNARFFIEIGKYSEQIVSFRKFFKDSQLLVLFYDDLLKDPESLIKRILLFLGVDEDFVPDMSRRTNVSGVPGNLALNKFITNSSGVKKLARVMVPDKVRNLVSVLLLGVARKKMKRPQLSDADRGELETLYMNEIQTLSKMLDRNLSHWFSDARESQ